MAANTENTATTVKSCLCGSVQQSPGLVPSVRAATAHKCRICRTKPRFLRSQRSLDLGANESTLGGTSHVGSPGRATTPAEPARRRARSAERYDGMRVNTCEQLQPSLELYFVRTSSRQLTLPSPQGREEQIRSPPPDYSPPPSNNSCLLPVSMLAVPASPPPSYAEAERTKGLSPPSYEESVAQTRQERSTSAARHQQTAATAAVMIQQLATSGALSQQQQQSMASHACSCSKCQASSSGSSRQMRSPVATELRVALPPETSTSNQYLRAPGAGALSASSHDQCSCYKCQSRYSGSGSYGDNNDDVLLTLETQSALQGVLTDGVALCSLV